MKQKIFNDPVYGFVNIPYGIILDMINHPYIQRLRRIKQLGLTHLVYPGALHDRFQHALGAVHLMGQVLEVLRSKGHEVTKKEEEAVCIAILLHDIGHGPFSHTLENSIVNNIDHEKLSLLFMNRLNDLFNDRLSLAIAIFENKHPKKFLYQLVCSQLDVDRMDYLNRDSFYTGVHEGIIGYDRIIKMLNVFNDELVVEVKGIYSVENFIIARRLMYWQVYLHKTVIAAEQMLVRILRRAKELCNKEKGFFVTGPLRFFLENHVSYNDFIKDNSALDYFSKLDDYDIINCVKEWTYHKDFVLSTLCSGLINRKLFKIELQNEPIAEQKVHDIKHKIQKVFDINEAEAGYLIFDDSTINSAYDPEEPRINILLKDNRVMDIADASDQLNISVLSKPVKKYYLCYPKKI